MILFTPSPFFFDAVINHSSVRPTTQRGSERLSSEDVLEDPANLAVAFEGGVALFRKVGVQAYDGHIFVLDGSRGSEALQFGKAALARLATRPDAIYLHTGVPLALPAARTYCRRLGLKSEGRDLFNEYFSTEIQQWAV